MVICCVEIGEAREYYRHRATDSFDRTQRKDLRRSARGVLCGMRRIDVRQGNFCLAELLATYAELTDTPLRLLLQRERCTIPKLSEYVKMHESESPLEELDYLESHLSINYLDSVTWLGVFG